jgi:hypothetical protein
MALENPIAIFTAASNVRAHAICHLLNQSGVEAYVTEDLSLVGLWMGGTLPGVHTPKVWVDQANAERAAAILQEHEQREEQLRDLDPGDPSNRISVTCDECGEVTEFPAAQRGSVQECPHCREYLDVDSEAERDDGAEDDESAGE